MGDPPGSWCSQEMLLRENLKGANVKSMKGKKSFFSLFFSAFSQNALLLLKFLSFFLGLRPQIPCQELPLKSKSSCGVVRAEDTFPNLDHLGGFGGALSHPPSGCRAPSAWGGSGREVGLGRVAQECHLQDCRYLFFLKF